MAVNVINPNKGRVYLSKEGLQLDSANLDKYHPNSNVNTLQVNIEDGGVLNTMAMINYQTPSMAVQSQAITSHWYPLFFIGINNVKVANEGGRRTFAQFLTPIPVNILNLNLGRSTPMNVKATVKLVGGVNFKGVFDSLGELQAQLPPTLELDEEYAIACVIDELGNVDYYQVDETSTDVYEWVKNSETTNPILSLLESKQYNIFNISVQGGFGNATPLPLATQHYQILWQAINNQGNAISDLNNKVDNVISSYQNTIQSVSETPTIKPTITSDLPNGKRLDLDVKISVENDLIEVESDGLAVKNEKVDERIDLKTNPIIQELDEHIEDLDNPHGVTAEQVDTYNKSTIDNKDANVLQEAKDYTYSKVEIDNKDTAIMNKANNLENANMFKDVSYNNVNGVLTFTKYDDTTKEIDLPLELIVTSGYYDEVANELVLVLANGSEIRIPVGDLLTDLDAHNVRFNGSGTNYLVSKTDVESAVKELDTQVKTNTDNVTLKVNELKKEVVMNPKYDLIIKNIVEKGNFPDDFSYDNTAWEQVNYVDWEVSNGVWSASSTSNFPVLRYYATFESAHKYFIKFGYKTSDPSSLIVRFEKETGDDKQVLDTSGNVANEWNEYKEIVTKVSDGELIMFRTQNSPNTSLSLKDVFIVDLTKTFGVGEEPTIQEFEKMVQQEEWFQNLPITPFLYDMIVENKKNIRELQTPGPTDLDANNIRFDGSGTNYLTDKLDVESAVKELDKTFEMFKQQFRGYNIPPNLEGKEHLGNGEYVLFEGVGSNIVTYNVNTGIYKYKNDGVDTISVDVISNLSNILTPLTEYTFTYNIISGTVNVAWRPNVTIGDMEVNNIHNRPTFQINDISPYNYLRLNWAKAVGDYEFTIQLEKGDTPTPYTVPGQIPVSKESVQNEGYLKTLPFYHEDMCFVGDELWGFSASDTGSIGNINIYDAQTLYLKKQLIHDFGHCNSIDYNEESDSLIFGNGGQLYSTDGVFYIIKGVREWSSLPEGTVLNLDSLLIGELVKYEVGTTWGSKINACWGESNLNENNIAYIMSNDNQNIRKVLLGKGTNELENGLYKTGKSSEQFNGTYKVLKEHIFEKLDNNQGSTFYNGALYSNLGHDNIWTVKYTLNYNEEMVQRREDIYDETGTPKVMAGAGIAIRDGYIYHGLRSGGLHLFKYRVF